MILVLVFAFLAGIVTILSPCILPILPVVLSSSVDRSGKRRPLGVVVGFIASFTFFTLFLSTLVRISGIPADSLRFLSIFVLIIFGLSLLVPKVQVVVEQFFGNLVRLAPDGKNQKGFLGGVVIGFSLGLLWTPCVGPILASVISLAITGEVNAQAVLITLAYSLGTAIPMFGIMQAGSSVLQKVPWLVKNTARIQKVFGILMIVTALGIFFNIDRRFQTWVLQTFPLYGTGLTKFEDNEQVRQQLKKVSNKSVDEIVIGKPMDLTQSKGMLAPELIPGGAWFNLPAGEQVLRLEDLKGKVVIVDFWTYSCINCQRTMPYLRSWWEKYKDQGLVIIGVHSPEFEFEKEKDNVAKAIADFELKYPIVQDNDFSTWRAYDNHYWPAKYFIDKDGYIRYSHFGEGAYDESEKIIRQLLTETGVQISQKSIANPDYEVYAQTPETYFGYLRLSNFSSPEEVIKDIVADYTAPSEIPVNTFAFGGAWSVMPEYATPEKGAKLYLNFEAKEVFLVARSKKGAGLINVFLDDKREAFGSDNIKGTVSVDEDRLYKLIKLPVPGRHILRLEFQDDNVEIFTFTFG